MALAAEPSDIDVLWVDNYGGTIWYGSKYIMPKPRAYVSQNSTVMVPFRAIVEGLLDGLVTWDEPTRMVESIVNAKSVEFSVDDGFVHVIIVEDRTFVTLEYMMEFISYAKIK